MFVHKCESGLIQNVLNVASLEKTNIEVETHTLSKHNTHYLSLINGNPISC